MDIMYLALYEKKNLLHTTAAIHLIKAPNPRLSDGSQKGTIPILPFIKLIFRLYFVI